MWTFVGILFKCYSGVYFLRFMSVILLARVLLVLLFLRFMVSVLLEQNLPVDLIYNRFKHNRKVLWNLFVPDIREFPVVLCRHSLSLCYPDSRCYLKIWWINFGKRCCRINLRKKFFFGKCWVWQLKLICLTIPLIILLTKANKFDNIKSSWCVWQMMLISFTT